MSWRVVTHSPIDKGVYAGAYISDTEKSLKTRENHSNQNDKAIKIKRFILVSIVVIISALQGHSSAYASSSIDALKLYAHSRIIDDVQYQCFSALINAESRWNVNAHNSNHWGLGQMANARYRNLDGYRQIDWSIRYINERYGSMCNAYRHFKKKGWH